MIFDIKKKLKNFFFEFKLKKNNNFLKKKKEKKNRFPISGIYNFDFNYNPKISLIVNHFTSTTTLTKSIKNIENYDDDIEIIVINDKFYPNKKLVNSINNSNHIIINSWDHGEVYGYMRGANISRATDFLIFSQDDDLLPDTKGWIEACLNEFNKDEKLGLIGFNGGGIYGKNYECIDIARKVPHSENMREYCSWLKFGPFIIRKNLYKEINGFKPIGQISESSNAVDRLLTLEVILAGYKAMLLKNEETKKIIRRFERDDGLKKEDLVKLKFRNLSFKDTDEIFNRLYKEKIDMISKDNFFKNPNNEI